MIQQGINQLLFTAAAGAKLSPEFQKFGDIQRAKADLKQAEKDQWKKETAFEEGKAPVSVENAEKFYEQTGRNVYNAQKRLNELQPTAAGYDKQFTLARQYGFDKEKVMADLSDQAGKTMKQKEEFNNFKEGL